MGSYPFLTSAYVEAVDMNLNSIWLAYRYGNGAFNDHRQHALIRYLTDPAFLGNKWRKGKLFFWGGPDHGTTRFRYPDGDNFLVKRLT